MISSNYIKYLLYVLKYIKKDIKYINQKKKQIIISILKAYQLNLSIYCEIRCTLSVLSSRCGHGSVCRGCIVRRLSNGARACPVCNIATSPPLLPDTHLQQLVYLMVPGLFRSELERRRHFRLVNPQCPPLAPPLGALDLTLDDFVSLSLQELKEPEDETRECDLSEGHDNASTRRLKDRKGENAISRSGSTRYLKCPAAVTVRHLVRLLMLKRGWEEVNTTVHGVNRIEIMYQQNDPEHADGEQMRPLDTSWTLLDLACIFRWKRVSLMVLLNNLVIEHFINICQQFIRYTNKESNIFL